MKKRTCVRLMMILIVSIVMSIFTITSLAKENEEDMIEATKTTTDVEVERVEIYYNQIKSVNAMRNVSMMQNLEQETEAPIAKEIVKVSAEDTEQWQGDVLTARLGVVEGPSGKETYYNLDMDGVIAIMQELGYDYEYSVRDDGVKLYGGYVMCAANLDLRPKGTIVETSLGMGIVCDTGEFASENPTQLDIAVEW